MFSSGQTSRRTDRRPHSKDKQYKHKRELLEDLERMDVTDLQIVLNDEGYAV
jgi:hypothetical protein